MGIRAALIGDPVSHSRSPRIYSALSIDYKAIRVPSHAVQMTLQSLAGQGYRGLNVTVPHKRAALALAARATKEAAAVGAANVLRLSARGAFAHNTDAAGFLDELHELGFSPRGKDAVVFGAGGAARAVGYALGKSRARNVRVVARKPAAARVVARSLARLFPGTSFSAGKAKPAALWINATPLGMQGYPDRAPFKGPSRCALAVDLVYGRDTAFLRSAKKAGAQAADGSAMLVYQALRSWEFWTDRRLSAARRRALKKALLKEIA